MAASVPTPFPNARAAPLGETLAIVAAPGIGVVMAALASGGVAIMAVVGAFLLTRDPYLAILALSYGPYAAAQILGIIMTAAVGWGIARLAARQRPQHALILAAGGALGSLLGAWLSPMALLGFIAAPWRFGPTLGFAPLEAGFVTLAGGVATIVPLLRQRQASPTLEGWRAVAKRSGSAIAWYALTLAVLLEARVVISVMLTSR